MKTKRSAVRGILNGARNRWPKKGWVSSETLARKDSTLTTNHSTMLRFARLLVEGGEAEKSYSYNKGGRKIVLYRAVR